MNVWMGGLVLMAFTSGSLLLSGPIEAAAEKKAMVDLQTALNSVNRGIKAKSLLKKESDEKMAEFEKKRKEIEELRQKLELQANTYSPEVLKTKQKEFQMKVEGFMMEKRQLDQEFAGKEMKYTQDIIEDMRLVIQDIATKEKYAVVYEKNESGILYIKDATDITNKLIDEFNKKYK